MKLSDNEIDIFHNYDLNTDSRQVFMPIGIYSVGGDEYEIVNIYIQDNILCVDLKELPV